MTKYIDLPSQHKLQTDFFFLWPFHKRVTWLFVTAFNAKLYKPKCFMVKQMGFKTVFWKQVFITEV